jgi:hypothetical protein
MPPVVPICTLVCSPTVRQSRLEAIAGSHYRPMLTILTAAEIGDQIVNVLERGLAATRAELQKLGVEYQGGKPLIMPTGWRVPRRIAFSPRVPRLRLHPAALGYPSIRFPQRLRRQRIPSRSEMTECDDWQADFVFCGGDHRRWGSRAMMEHNASPHRLAASGETPPTSLKPAGRLLSEFGGRSRYTVPTDCVA